MVSSLSPREPCLPDIGGDINREWHRVYLAFDEGQDASGGPDQFGAAILDKHPPEHKAGR
jgi:hypothetical protein